MSHDFVSGGECPAPSGSPWAQGGAGFQGNRTTLVLGAPRSGKTWFALQTAVASAQSGQPVLFASSCFEQSNWAQGGAKLPWNLRDLSQRSLLMFYPWFFPGRPKGGPCDFATVFDPLVKIVRETRARRIVLDDLHHVLEAASAGPALGELTLRVRDWLMQHELSAVITLRSAGSVDAFEPGRMMLDWLADCVVGLEDRNGVRVVRFLKYRGSECERREYPLQFANGGMEVLAPNSSEAHPPAPGPGMMELAKARRELAGRIRGLDGFLEAKQTELEFAFQMAAVAQANAVAPTTVSLRPGP